VRAATAVAMALAIAASAPAGAATPVHDAAAFFKTTDYSIAESRRAYSADGSRLLLTANPTGVYNVMLLDLKTGAIDPLTNSSGIRLTRSAGSRTASDSSTVPTPAATSSTTCMPAVTAHRAT
jgi:Tol biopolymer transport system component